jgi:hypothetical protein
MNQSTRRQSCRRVFSIMESKMKTMFLIATFVALSTMAHAGSNQCDGKVKINEWRGWTIVVDKDGSGCQFKTASKIGKRILSVCKAGDTCFIELALPRPAGTVDKLPPVQTIQSAADIIDVSKINE